MEQSITTNDTNKQWDVPQVQTRCTPKSEVSTSLVLIQKIATGSAGKGNGPGSEHAPGELGQSNSLACLSVFPG